MFLFTGPLESDPAPTGANGNIFIDFSEFQAGFQIVIFFSYLTHISWNNIGVYNDKVYPVNKTWSLSWTPYKGPVHMMNWRDWFPLPEWITILLWLIHKNASLFLHGLQCYTKKKQKKKEKKMGLRWVFLSKLFIPRTKTTQFSCRRVHGGDWLRKR